MRNIIQSAYREYAGLMPPGSKLVLFGSSISSPDPNDIDVIIVYDGNLVDPKKAFELHQSFISSMSKRFSVPLHVMMLNEAEYRESNIRLHENYIEI